MRKIAVIAAVAVLATGFGLQAAEKTEPKKGDAAAVVKGNNDFAFDMYGQLRHDEGQPVLLAVQHLDGPGHDSRRRSRRHG